MIEKNILEFHQEIGEIKDGLLEETLNGLDDQDKYTMATKLDLAVSRFLRLEELIKGK